MSLRKLALLIIVLMISTAAGAQTVTLTASNIKKLDNTTFTGKLCLAPSNNAGSVINFQYGNGGQGTAHQVCYPVVAGVLQAGLQVPDTHLTNPQNLCLYGQLIDPTQPPQKQIVGTYTCLQPASSGQSWCSTTGGVTTCDLDNYAPSQGALVVQQTGIQGPAGTVAINQVTTGASGTQASVTNVGTATQALLNIVIPEGPPGPAGPGGSGAPGATDVSAITASDFGAKLSSCIGGLNSTYGGICEARGLGYSTQSMASTLTISQPNTVINLPCATITTSQQIVITAGTRNVTIHGCGYQGGSNASGTQGGTVWVYTGTGAAIQVGDTTYAQDTKGFHIDNVNINTANAGTAAKAIAFYRTQEIDLRNLYFNGNQTTGQTGIYLDGTGNYSGGSFDSNTLNGFGIGLYMTGHLSGSAVGDYANASTFTRLHIVCPTSGGSPITGTYGVSIAAGDGNTWNGGDVEGCDTMFHLGANAVNNTILGLRNENSNTQYLADSGSSYNSVVTGGTFFTGDMVDNGSRNSFSDAFHRDVNGVKGDWWASQTDATTIDHLRLGTGSGTVRGHEWESQVDVGTTSSQYNWLWGLTDGASGQSNWIFQDLINNVIRIQLQENNTAGGNNGTAINGAGTGNVCFNCSGNAGTGGVAFSSGGATPTTVATVDSSGDANFLGTLQVGGVSTLIGSATIKNQANAEIDMTLYAGSTAAQKESFIYKDYTGASQWYMVNDTADNWALNSAPGSIDAIKAYQSTNSGDLYLDSTNTTGTVRVNYESGAGSAFSIYGGSSSSLLASFTNGAYKFPGIAVSSGHGCLHVDNSGFITNTGADCGTGNGNGSLTSVGLSLPTDFNVTTATVTSAGTLTAAWANEAANLVHAGPASGSAAAPTWRALVAADLPSSITSNTTGTAAGLSATLGLLFGGTGATTAAGALTNLGAVGTSTTVNGHALNANVTVSAADVGNATAQWNANLINGGGMPASASVLGTNSSSQPVAATSHGLSVPANCVAASGSGTAYTCTTSPAFTPAAGDHIQFKADVANTGAASLSVNSASAATIKKWGGAGNLIANDLLAGHWISATFDGTYWQLEGQLGNANATQINGTAISAFTGSGSTIVLNNAPTFTGNATTFANAAASQDYVIIQPGTGGADYIGALEFANNAGTSQWEIRKDATNYFRIRDTVNGADREIDYPGGQTLINSGGSASVAINNTNGSGTGGFAVYEGGSNYSVLAFTVNSSGNATVGSGSGNGSLAIGNHLNQQAAGDFGGTCAMSSGTSCTFSLQHSFTSTPLCFASVQSSTVIAGSCTISSGTVTVYAATSNSATWNAVLVGNPN